MIVDNKLWAQHRRVPELIHRHCELGWDGGLFQSIVWMDPASVIVAAVAAAATGNSEPFGSPPDSSSVPLLSVCHPQIL